MSSAILLTVCASLLFATAELFTRFRDEPFLITRNITSWFYLLINVLISLITLLLITRTELFGTSQTDWIKAGLAAGFGASVLLRSKFMKINVDGREVALGPEIIINIILEALERKIDRDRSIVRKVLAEKCMAEIDFQLARDYVVMTIVGSRQIISDERTKELMDEVRKIDESSLSDADKSISLGYLILDFMGERFLERCFSEPNRRRFIRPLTDDAPPAPGP